MSQSELEHEVMRVKQFEQQGNFEAKCLLRAKRSSPAKRARFVMILQTLGHTALAKRVAAVC